MTIIFRRNPNHRFLPTQASSGKKTINRYGENETENDRDPPRIIHRLSDRGTRRPMPTNQRPRSNPTTYPRFAPKISWKSVESRSGNFSKTLEISKALEAWIFQNRFLQLKSWNRTAVYKFGKFELQWRICTEIGEKVGFFKSKSVKSWDFSVLRALF